MHPAIQKAYNYCVKNALDTKWLHKAAIEWPHVDNENPLVVVYTQTPEKGAKKITTSTRVGRYLKRLIPELTDKAVELLSAETKVNESRFEIVSDDQLLGTILSCSGDGPSSCMAGPKKTFTSKTHPFRVYSSRLGWSMACRFVGDTLAARALLNSNCYVRIYGPTNHGKTNPDDPQLRDWLNEKGYTKLPGWEGFELEIIHFGHDGIDVLAPYVDGLPKTGVIKGDTISIQEGGPIKLDTLDGYTAATVKQLTMVTLNNGERVPAEEACELEYTIKGTPREGYHLLTDCVETWGGWMALKSDCVKTWEGDYTVWPYATKLTAGDHAGEYERSSVIHRLYDGHVVSSADEVVYVDIRHLPQSRIFNNQNFELALKEDCVYINGKWQLPQSHESKKSHMAHLLNSLSKL